MRAILHFIGLLMLVSCLRYCKTIQTIAHAYIVRGVHSAHVWHNAISRRTIIITPA